eukprot:gene22575-24168_t
MSFYILDCNTVDPTTASFFPAAFPATRSSIAVRIALGWLNGSLRTMMLMLKLQTLAMLLVLLLGVVAMLEPALKRHRGQDYEAKQALTTKVAALKAGGDVLFKEAWLLGRTGQTRKMNARDRADHTAAYSQKCTEAFAAGHSLARVGQRYGVGTDDRKLCDIAMVTMLAGFPQRFGLTFEDLQRPTIKEHDAAIEKCAILFDVEFYFGKAHSD